MNEPRPKEPDIVDVKNMVAKCYVETDIVGGY
jgi:hypothetical protein